jgi:NADH-quinone oxidoreductase subunit N
MVAAVIAAFLYLRIMVNVWLDTGDGAAAIEPVPIATGLAVFAAAVFTIFVGVWPNWLLDAADTVTQYAR